jgi:hypothetical protein
MKLETTRTGTYASSTWRWSSLWIQRQTGMSVSCNIVNQQEAEILKSSSGWCVQMTEKQVFIFIFNVSSRGLCT